MSEIIVFAMIVCYNEEKHFAGSNTMVISYKKALESAKRETFEEGGIQSGKWVELKSLSYIPATVLYELNCRLEVK